MIISEDIFTKNISYSSVNNVHCHIIRGRYFCRLDLMRIGIMKVRILKFTINRTGKLVRQNL